MSRIFREIFCGHFPWKLKDENLRKISPKFCRIFRRSLRKISQELRSGGLRAQLFLPLIFALFRRAPAAPRNSRKRKEKGFFPQISSDCLKPPFLKPPFVALQKIIPRLVFRSVLTLLTTMVILTTTVGASAARNKRRGFKQIRGYPRKKDFFLRFLDFSSALSEAAKGGLCKCGF